MNIEKLSKIKTRFGFAAFYSYALTGIFMVASERYSILTIPGSISVILFIFSLPIWFILSTILNFKKRELGEIVGKILLIIIVIVLGKVAFSILTQTWFKAHTERGIDLLYKEFSTNGFDTTAFPDSLRKDPSVKAVLKNFTIIEHSNEEHNKAWYFHPKENSKAYSGICVDDRERISKYHRDSITSYEECVDTGNFYIIQ